MRAALRVHVQDRALRSLWLQSNSIGDDGARELAEALASNMTLRELQLFNNGIGAD